MTSTGMCYVSTGEHDSTRTDAKNKERLSLWIPGYRFIYDFCLGGVGNGGERAQEEKIKVLKLEK